MKSLVYAVRSNTRVELIEKIMERGDSLRNDGDVIMRAMNSVLQKELKGTSTTIALIFRASNATLNSENVLFIL